MPLVAKMLLSAATRVKLALAMTRLDVPVSTVPTT
jgi:hypothetical protein